MRYFATVEDAGIEIVAADVPPHGAVEVENVHEYANERGMTRLAAGGTLLFNERDQGWGELASLFYAEAP